MPSTEYSYVLRICVAKYGNRRSCEDDEQQLQTQDDDAPAIVDHDATAKAVLMNGVVRVSDPSLPCIVKTTGPCSPPQLKLSSRSHTHIELTWQDSKCPPTMTFDSMDKTSTVIATHLECNGYMMTLPATVTSFRLSKLAHSQRHTFRIRQSNVHGTGDWSEPACFETLKANLQYCVQCGGFLSSEGHSTVVKLGSQGIKMPKCQVCGFGLLCATTYSPHGILR